MKTALLYRAEPMPITVAVGPGAHSHAAEHCDRTRTVVRFDDLNLSYDIDVEVLYRRIRIAAADYAPINGAGGAATAVDRIVAATVAAIQHHRLSEHHRRMTS